ncbi:T9SS type A sorting domain-containing protein [Aequorivita viscosa]|nr:T9SS type A sorting domain-containing protein [Aequorivita viscosa]
MNVLVKIKYLLFALVLTLYYPSFAQCPTSDYVFVLTQEDVDNFLIDYPNCTELQRLYIGDILESNITNLDGFINLERITGVLQVMNVPINNFEGLNNLTSVGDFVLYAFFDTLESLEGLEGLTHANYFSIELTYHLTSLKGLENLESVGDNFRLVDNFVLQDLSYLQSLQSIGEGFLIKNCDLLTNFNGLENLSSIGGDQFKVDDNDNLIDCAGLDCYFFSEGFRNSIPSYTLQSSLYPSIFDICGILILSTDEFSLEATSFYPNPASTDLYLENFENVKQIQIFDMMGRLIKIPSITNNSLDISSLKPGTYIFQVTFNSNKISNNKLVVK